MYCSQKFQGHFNVCEANCFNIDLFFSTLKLLTFVFTCSRKLSQLNLREEVFINYY